MDEPGVSFYADCSLYESRSNSNQLLKPEADWRYATSLKMCAKGQGSMMLDIGCGEGAFLWLARKRGHDVYGLDLDSRAVATAQKDRGLTNIECGVWTDLASMKTWKDFDIVTLFDVLEHVSDPLALIRQVHTLLRSGGQICITVPRLDRYPRVFDPVADAPPHHLTLWTGKALTSILERAGFEEIQVVEKPLMAEDFAAIVTWRSKRFLRRWGMIGAVPDSQAQSQEEPVATSSVIKSKLRKALKGVLSVPAGMFRMTGLGRGCTLLVFAKRR